jgi:glyoxylase-like metal-dependent hydrolase (beta-lactamase superfamily II)
LGRPTVRAHIATHGHPDHAGGGAFIHARFRCPIYLPPEDFAVFARQLKEVPWQPLPPWRTLSVGNIRLEILHAPGHTPGQRNFWLPDVGGLLAGDNILGQTTVIIGPPDGNMSQYLATLRRLAALPLRWIGPGHGPIVRQPREHIEMYLSHRREREQAILALLRDGPKTPTEIARAIYRGRLSAAQLHLGEWMVQGHLDDLVQRGLVQRHTSQHYRVVG